MTSPWQGLKRRVAVDDEGLAPSRSIWPSTLRQEGWLLKEEAKAAVEAAKRTTCCGSGWQAAVSGAATSAGRGAEASLASEEVGP